MLNHSMSILTDSDCVAYILATCFHDTFTKFIINVEESIIKLIRTYDQMPIKVSSKFQAKIYLTGTKDH